MEAAAAILIGEHDFSAFRSAECQAASPVKLMRSIAIRRRGAYWRIEFDASAFLHHMVRNIMGCLLAVGSGNREPAWLAEVLASRDAAGGADLRRRRALLRRAVLRCRHAIPSAPPRCDWLP
jgi:tRNA pseudouridine38-40 synthase